MPFVNRFYAFKRCNKFLSIIYALAFVAAFFALSPTYASEDATEYHNSEAVSSAQSSHGSQEHTDNSAHGSEDKFHLAAEKMSRELPLWTGLPFAGILLSIALFPLLAGHFWHKHFPKISFAWALLFIIPFVFVYKGLAVYEIIHIYLIDYIPFIVLLWGLYTVSGGIMLRGSLVGSPIVNLIMLLVGTLLASWMGTTGAAMLMIRPILRANKHRKNKVHIVIFFIFLVANVGGALTPLGDPPLFLGFLHGVPFFWTLTHLLPHFGLAASILLIIFFLLDSFMLKREGGVLPGRGKDPLRLEGSHNFIFLAGILGLVLLSGIWKSGHVNIYGVHLYYQNMVRDFGIVLMGTLSMLFTSKKLRKDNEFSWFPIMEVAYLFAGIFATIIPMLSMLKAGTEGAMGFIIAHVNEPYQYFWITGLLSSFLDNAPTYLTFFNLALGRLGLSEAAASQILISGTVVPFVVDLIAISAGAVFFGACTYIGNAPNFMVRSIAEESGVKMPSFFGYMLWSLTILVPTFVIITLVFFATGGH